MDILIVDKILGKALFETLAILVFGVVAALIINRAIYLSFQKIKNRSSLASYNNRLNTLRALLENVLYITILGIAFLMALKRIGLDITPILTGAGLLGLAVSFGSQTLVRDLISGFFIIVENQFNVGDKVKIANIEGKVIAINLRTTVLENKHQRIYIPNSEIKNVVVNKP